MLVFDLGAVSRLAALTRSARVHRPVYSMTLDPALRTNGQLDLEKVPPHLQLVHHHADGVYLRSSALEGEGATLKVYADGMNPDTHPGWRARASAILGEPGTAEEIDLAWVDQARQRDPLSVTFRLTVEGEEIVLALQEPPG